LAGRVAFRRAAAEDNGAMVEPRRLFHLRRDKGRSSTERSSAQGFIKSDKSGLCILWIVLADLRTLNRLSIDSLAPLI
jgi:hypothetical protein